LLPPQAELLAFFEPEGQPAGHISELIASFTPSPCSRRQPRRIDAAAAAAPPPRFL